MGGLVTVLFGVVVFFPGCSLSCYEVTFENDIHKEPDFGEPLFLTNYLDSGKVEEARNLSKVVLPNAPEVESYSGFFKVNREYYSDIFFWFFPAVNGDKEAPVLLWLQGGPGTSSLFGLFVEHGPYFVRSNLSVDIREFHWAKNFHMIYVDNPVGAGFSFTMDKKGYATNESQVADDLYKFLEQFFTVFPEYSKNEFYITGESYGGKYVPALAYKIHTTPTSTINLKGMAIGNGLCDPETMIDYSDYLYHLGLVDRKQAAYMRNKSKEIVQLIQKEKFFRAVIEMDQLMLDFNVLNYTSFFKQSTDYDFFYNFLRTEEPPNFEFFKKYVQLPEVRRAIHVGNITFQDGKMAETFLLGDIMKSVKPQIAVIMDNYRVMFYNGQLDLVIPYTSTVNFLSSVDWKHAEGYRNSDRVIWKLTDTDRIAGYVHNVGDFYEVLVRDAGHILPYDQPKVALDLITRFIRGKSFS